MISGPPVRSSALIGMPASDSILRRFVTFSSYVIENPTISIRDKGVRDSSVERGSPLCRKYSSISRQGAKQRSHQTPSRLLRSS